MRPKDSRIQSRVFKDWNRDLWMVAGTLDGAEIYRASFPSYNAARMARLTWQRDQRAALGENIKDGRARNAD